MSNILQEHVKIVSPTGCTLLRVYVSGMHQSAGEFQLRKIQDFRNAQDIH